MPTWPANIFKTKSPLVRKQGFRPKSLDREVRTPLQNYSALLDCCDFQIPHHVPFLMLVTYFLFTSQARDINLLYWRESLEHVTPTFMLLFPSLGNAQHGCPDCLNTAGKMSWLQMMQMFIVSCSDWFCGENSKMNMAVTTIYFAC